MIIDGANLGKKNVQLNDLTFYNWAVDSQSMEIIKSIEDMYKSLIMNNTAIMPINIGDDGKVIIGKGMLNHRCSGEIENLKNISQYGILASEWFGELESENEGRFCTFISRTKGNNYTGGLGDLAEDDYSRLNIGENVLLFLDDSNEIMKKLLHLDYFEYEYNKSINASKIGEIYTEKEIKILDFIEELSPAGMNMRKPYDFKTNYWSAIPGGIPSFLVNGICIKKINYSDEELDKISELYPNAVIFNNEKNVIRQPLNFIQQKHIK